MVISAATPLRLRVPRALRGGRLFVV